MKKTVKFILAFCMVLISVLIPFSIYAVESFTDAFINGLEQSSADYSQGDVIHFPSLLQSRDGDVLWSKSSTEYIPVD